VARAAIDVAGAATQLLACLTIAVEAATNPPARIQFLVGAQAGEDLSIYDDMCCEGTAYVRVANQYPSFENFPSPDVDAIPCQLQAIGAIYEMGIMRCAPVGTVQSIATPAQWAAANTQMLIDAQSMFKAACCFASTYSEDAVLVGSWVPGGPSGGCLLGTVSVTHQIAGCGGMC